MGPDQLHGGVQEDAVQLAVGADFRRAALGHGGVFVRADNFEGLRIHRQRMAAAAHDADGPVRAHRVQVMPGRCAGGRGEHILIEAPGEDPPLRMRFGEGAQSLLHVREGGCRLGQVALLHQLAQAQQVHVAVVEAGAHEASLQRGNLVAGACQGQHLLVRACCQEDSVLHGEGLLEGQYAGKDPAVHVNRLHMQVPFGCLRLLYLLSWRTVNRPGSRHNGNTTVPVAILRKAWYHGKKACTGGPLCSPSNAIP